MKISQREARRLRAEVRAKSQRISSLENDIRRWRNYGSLPEGVEIMTISASDSANWVIHTAQNLKHTVLARHRDGKIVFTALPSPGAK